MKRRIDKILASGDICQMKLLDPSGLPIEMLGSLEAIIDGNKIILKAEMPPQHRPIKSIKTIEVTSYKDAYGIVKVEGQIEELAISGSHLVLQVSIASEAEQIQRRAFFRLPIFREVTIINPQNEKINAFSQNISAGGLRCFMNAQLDEGALIDVSVCLSDEVFDFKAQVLEVAMQDEKKPNFMIRLAFVNLDEKEQSRLMSVIFSEQSKQKKKEVSLI